MTFCRVKTVFKEHFRLLLLLLPPKPHQLHTQGHQRLGCFNNHLLVDFAIFKKKKDIG